MPLIDMPPLAYPPIGRSSCVHFVTILSNIALNIRLKLLCRDMFSYINELGIYVNPEVLLGPTPFVAFYNCCFCFLFLALTCLCFGFIFASSVLIVVYDSSLLHLEPSLKFFIEVHQQLIK